MEKFTVYIEYTTSKQLQTHLKRLLEIHNIKFIELHIVFSNITSNKAVLDILEIEKNLSLLTEVVFSNYAIIKFDNKLKSFLKRLYAKNFCVEIYLNDTIVELLKKKSFRKILIGRKSTYKLFIDSCDNPESDYIKYSKIGLPLNFAKPDYSTDLRDWFDRWAVNQNAVPINIFDQIFRVILLSDNTHNCCFNSCFGKNLYISQDSTYSFCPKNPNETVLSIMDITTANTLSDIFENDGFISILEASLKKRESCLEKCPEFAFCQGGCPLISQDECVNKNYVMLVLHIKNFIEKVLQSNDLSKYNYSIKDAIYAAIAFNSTFGILKNEGSENE